MGMGIAVGYSTKLPSHQLGEVCDGIISVIKNPEIDLDGIMKYIKGPDFAGGAQLINNSNIREFYETGKASLTFKAKYKIKNNEETGNAQIEIYELPPDVKKPKLMEKIHKLCLEDKSIPRVTDVRDLSRGAEINVVIELHKTAVPEIIINELFEKTDLMKNITYISRVIVNKAPKCLGLKEIIEHYIEHRRTCVLSQSKFLKEKTIEKLHIQEGLQKVTDDIDSAISIIKDSETVDEAKKALAVKFGLTDAQIMEVLEIKLRQLTKLNKNDIIDLIKKLSDELTRLETVLSDSKEVDKVIIKDLHELKKKYNDERRTELIGEQVQTIVSDEAEPITLVLTSKNTIKHITLKALEDMIKAGSLKERTEVYIQGVKCNMKNQFLLILNTGEYVKIDFSDLMSNMNFLDEKKHIIKAIVIYDDSKKDRVVMTMTKKGIIQKIKMSGFRARNKKVSPLFKEMQENDEIIAVRVSDTTEDTENIITLATKSGLVHRFFEKSFKEMASAGGKGINGITLSDGDEVVSFDVSKQSDDENSKIILFTENEDKTYGMKNINLTEFKPKGRISQGIKAVEFGKKVNGNIYNFVIAKDNFFTLDKKGIVTNYDFDKLPNYTRYNKADSTPIIVEVSKFFLE